jgi:hypothetical protein
MLHAEQRGVRRVSSGSVALVHGALILHFTLTHGCSPEEKAGRGAA